MRVPETRLRPLLALLNEKELLKHWIGDAEVTVLVPRLQSEVE